MFSSDFKSGLKAVFGIRHARSVLVPYNPISNIKENEEAQPIEIRVIKKWTPPLQTTEFCYLFVDVNGDAIQATAPLDEQPRLDATVNIRSCYIVERYICLPQKTYNPAVPHKASLRIGKKATFTPTSNNKIPHHYYNFASYSELQEREKPPKMLTDYIGRVENTRHMLTKRGQRFKKIKIQDTRENTIELTFWPAQSSLFPENIKEGDIIAVTSMAVTTFNGKPQLETTPATTITVNPTTPDTSIYTSRLQRLTPKTTTEENITITTIAEMLTKSTNEKTNQNRYTCLAKIKEIHKNRNWYYVLCPKCPKKLHLLKGPPIKFECEDDEDIQHPKFMYCVNATITDDTSEVDVVFFDEAMRGLLDITCEEMVTIRGLYNQRQIPELMSSIVNVPRLMTMTVKPDAIAVNTTFNTWNTTVTMTPATPAKRSR